MSHAAGKGESPFLREFNFAEGHFRLTESEKKEKNNKKNVRVGWVHPTAWKDGGNPKNWLLFPRTVAVVCITLPFYYWWIALMATKFLLWFWGTPTMAYKRLLLDLQALEKHSFLYLLSSLKLPGEGTTGSPRGSYGSRSGRHESTGQRKPQIINTCWALTDIYTSQREVVGPNSETFGTFQAVCKMSPSLSPASHPPKLRSYVIGVTPTQLQRETMLFLIQAESRTAELLGWVILGVLPAGEMCCVQGLGASGSPEEVAPPLCQVRAS